MRRWALPCFVCLVTLSNPIRVQAQAAGGDLDLAKRYYALGEELYQRSNYEGALAQFQQAYKASAKPDLLYNIARCYEAMGKPQEAINHYRRYLKKASASAKDREIVTARLANLERKAKLAQQRELARVKALDAERKRREQLEREAQAAREKAEQESRKRQAVQNSNVLGIAGWTTAGVGLAAVVVGSVLGAMAKSKASSLEDANSAGTPFAEVRDDIDKGKTFEAASIGLLIGGGVTALAGGVLLFLHYRKGSAERSAANEAPRLVVLPSVTPQGVSLGATFRF